MISARDLKARLTASVVLNTLATSGSSRTIFVPSLYFWTSYQTNKPLIRLRTLLIGLGCIFYCVVGIIDGSLELNSLLPLLFVRLLLLASLIILYLGYNTPQRIRLRYSNYSSKSGS